MATLSAAEVLLQLEALKEDVRCRDPGQLAGVHFVSSEFFRLKVQRTSEILDFAAGSGILSAELQTGG